MIKIRAINGSPETPLPQERFGSYFDGEFFNVFETQAEADNFYASLPVSAPIQVDEVAAWRVRAAMVIHGIDLDMVTAAINQLPHPPRYVALQAWEYGNSFDKFSPTIQGLGQALNIDIDSIWETAKNITL